MKVSKFAAGLALAAGMALATPAGAVVVHDEATDGDLSNDGLAPTPLSFSLGGNEIFGTSGASGDSVDLDYFTFTVLPGQALTAIQVLEGTESLENLSFIAIQRGDQVTVAPDAETAVGLYGWWHYSPADIGSDILDDIGVPAAGSEGFTPPLGAGDYAIWIQEANQGTADYRFSFVLGEAGAVPEPEAWALLLGGLAILAARRRKLAR